MPKKRISLDEKDFATLTAGGIVEQDGVLIILKDIGYANMIDIVTHHKDEAGL